MYAVVKTGGKQLKVAVGETISVERLDAAPGSVVELSALMVNDDKKMLVGKDAAEVSIKAEVVGHGKGDKVIVFKFKKRKGYKKLRGHRQELTLVKITDIAVGGKKAAKVETEAKAAAKPKPAAKPTEKKAPAAKKPAAKPKPAAKKAPAAKKPAAKKPPAKKTDKPAE